MTTEITAEEKAGSGLQQWGSDWFFKKDGKKRSLDTAKLKWAGAVFVAVIGAVQFTDIGSSSVLPNLHLDSIGLPSLGNTSESRAQHEFPPAKESPKPKPSSQAPATKAPTRAVKLAGPALISRPRNLSAIPPGSMVKATLMSGASNGSAKAKLEEALLVNGEVVLESGATLVGQGNSTEARLVLSFNQVVFRDGTFGNIHAQACDASDQIVGLKGSKIGGKALNVAGSIGLGFVGGLSEGLQDTQGQQGATVRPPTMRNALLHATAMTALEQSQNLMSDLKERRPTIEVPAGTPILVLFGGGQ